MKRVLVTGASGFVGHHCLPLLCDQDYEVHAVARTTRPYSPAVIWHHADLLTPGLATGLIEAIRPTHLLHLAWCASPHDYLTNPANLGWTTATVELVEAFAAKGGERFVGAGTCAEYAPSAVACDERTTPLLPASLYGEAKVAAFQRLAELAAGCKFSFGWGRIFFPYGAYQAPERLIPSLITALLRGEPFDCDVGERKRDFIHVRDVAAALVAMLGAGASDPFNIGAGVGVTVREVITLAARIVDGGSVLRFGAKPQSVTEPAVIVADTRRLHDELGWRPRISLEEGLTATVDWWRDRVADRGL